MSTPILPLAVWQSGTNENSIPANDNALRVEILTRQALGTANSGPAAVQGDVWLVGSSPTGNFSTFSPDDIAIYDGLGWHAYAPIDGLPLIVDNVRMMWTASNGWDLDPTVGGGGGGASWGSITGTLSAQTDLQTALDAKETKVIDVITPTNSSGTVTLDFAGKSKYIGSITLAANVTTLAFSNLPGAGKYAEYEFHIKQDGSGSHTFAIPASHKALGGSDTSIASAANAVTVLTASTVDNGTTWRYAMQESA